MLVRHARKESGGQSAKRKKTGAGNRRPEILREPKLIVSFLRIEKSKKHSKRCCAKSEICYCVSMSNTLNLTRAEIETIFDREGVSPTARFILGKLLDKVVTAEDASFEEKVILAWKTCPMGSSPLVHAVKTARLLRPSLGLAEAKAAAERVRPAGY